jgi:hypothetical protein
MPIGRGTSAALVLSIGLVATAHGTTITVNAADPRPHHDLLGREVQHEQPQHAETFAARSDP